MERHARYLHSSELGAYCTALHCMLMYVTDDCTCIVQHSMYDVSSLPGG